MPRFQTAAVYFNPSSNVCCCCCSLVVVGALAVCSPWDDCTRGKEGVEGAAVSMHMQQRLFRMMVGALTLPKFLLL